MTDAESTDHFLALLDISLEIRCEEDRIQVEVVDVAEVAEMQQSNVSVESNQSELKKTKMRHCNSERKLDDAFGSR